MSEIPENYKLPESRKWYDVPKGPFATAPEKGNLIVTSVKTDTGPKAVAVKASRWWRVKLWWKMLFVKVSDE